MALHYWRPDFTAEQARMVMGDYLDDLETYTSQQVQSACEEYRRAPGSEFFPKICQLLEIMKPSEPSWSISTPTLQPYRSGEFRLAAPIATQSVADVLRKHGYTSAADKWANRTNTQ